MEYYEKRPCFKAVCYDGTMDSLQQMCHMLPITSWSINSDSEHSSVLTVIVGDEDFEWRVPLNYHLVVSPGRRDGVPLMQVLSSAQLSARFEPVKA